MAPSGKLILVYLAAVWLATAIALAKNNVPLACPQSRDGKALRDVGLFEGLPQDKMELMPEPGYFLVPQGPPELWSRNPAYYLGCRYKGTSTMVEIELPRTVKRCEIVQGPNVQCH